MEEPPKIERIISSRGASLSGAAAILQTYVSNIDQYHYHQDDYPSVNNGRNNLTATPREDRATTENEDGEKSECNPRKSRQEREEESLLAQMDQLANSSKSLSAGMISDDVYERLKMISDSLYAEVGGKTLSACRVAVGACGRSVETVDDGPLDQANEILADAEVTETSKRVEQKDRVLQPLGEETVPQPAGPSERDRRREKKARKKTKKQAKREKRKQEVNKTERGGIGPDRKRTKAK